MSTKAIREALSMLNAIAPTGVVGKATADAWAEVEAIETAAEVLMLHDDTDPLRQFSSTPYGSAFALMREIADAAPKHEEKA